MAAKFLGQFLLERGVITAPQLLAAIEAQRASNPLLGELAVREGLLDATQARRINQRQHAEDRRFGDLALEMGLLDQAQLDALLEAQKLGRKMIGQVLLEQGAVDADRLDAELARHRSGQDEARHALDSRIAQHPLSDLANSAIGVCARLFPRMLGSQCHASAVLAPQDLPASPLVAHVRVHGDHPFGIGLASDAAAARALACALLGITPDRCDDALAVDALGEMVNVLMGYVVRDALPDDDATYQALPPDTSIAAATIAADPARSLAIRLDSQLGAFVLLLDRTD